MQNQSQHPCVQSLRRNWRYVTSLIAVLILVRYVGIDSFWESVHHLDIVWLSLHFLAAASLPFLYVLEVWLVTRFLGYRINWTFLFSAVINAWSIGTLTPSRAGDLSLAYFLKTQVASSMVLAFVATSRMITLAFFCVAAIIGSRHLPPGLQISILCGAFSLLLALVAVSVGINMPFETWTCLAKLRSLFGRLPEESLIQTRALLTDPRYLGMNLLFATLRFVWGIATNLMLFFAVKASPPLGSMATATATSRILSLLPFSFWGVGIKEPLQILIYEPAGIRSDQVLAVSVIGFLWMGFLAAILPLCLRPTHMRRLTENSLAAPDPTNP